MDRKRMPKTPDSNAVLAQFSLLMGEILGGSLRRNKFQPWEVEILLEIESCQLRGSDMREALSEYQDVVQAEIEKGAHLPLKFSDFVERREHARMQRKPAKGASGTRTKPSRRLR